MYSCSSYTFACLCLQVHRTTGIGGSKSVHILYIRMFIFTGPQNEKQREIVKAYTYYTHACLYLYRSAEREAEGDSESVNTLYIRVFIFIQVHRTRSSER